MKKSFSLIRVICCCDMCQGKESKTCIMLRGPHGYVSLCDMHAQALAWSAIRRAG